MLRPGEMSWAVKSDLVMAVIVVFVALFQKTLLSLWLLSSLSIPITFRYRSW